MTTNVQLSPVSVNSLSQQLQLPGDSCCLVDIRPSAQHCSNHIQSSDNINFSNILLRRLVKGIVALSAHLSPQSLVEKITRRDATTQTLVLYDNCSKAENLRTELVNHAGVLYKTESGDQNVLSTFQVYYLDGGFKAFSEHYPELCCKGLSSVARAHTPMGISVSISLPISIGRPASKKQPQRAQTPMEDDSSRFGPPVEVLPYLALGCERDSGNLTVLRRFGITAVLNVSHNCINHFQELFEYKTIPVEDSHHADLLSKLQTSFDFINSVRDRGGKVFVHCHAGISRSATVCIAYVMKHLQKDLTNAYDFVKQKRPCISPNLHFMGQLLEFQKILVATNVLSVESTREVGMEIDNVPVTTPTTAATVNSSSEVLPATIVSTRDRKSLCLPLNLPCVSPKRSLSVPSGRSLKSASAPGSLDIPAGVQIKSEKPERRLTVSAVPAPCPDSLLKHKNTRLLYRSTDSKIYQIVHTDSNLQRQRQVSANSVSLPSTPDANATSTYFCASPTSCRYQNQQSANSLENSMQYSGYSLV